MLRHNHKNGQILDSERIITDFKYSLIFWGYFHSLQNIGGIFLLILAMYTLQALSVGVTSFWYIKVCPAEIQAD